MSPYACLLPRAYRDDDELPEPARHAVPSPPPSPVPPVPLAMRAQIAAGAIDALAQAQRDAALDLCPAALLAALSLRATAAQALAALALRLSARPLLAEEACALADRCLAGIVAPAWALRVIEMAAQAEARDTLPAPAPEVAHG